MTLERRAIPAGGGEAGEKYLVMAADGTLRWTRAGGNMDIIAANPAAARVMTLPDPGADDSFVFLAATQTLAGKTLTAPTLTGTVLFNGQQFREITTAVGAALGTLFQHNTANSRTVVAIAPNGTSVFADLILYRTSTLVTHVEYINLGWVSTDAFLSTQAAGSGSVRPLVLGAGGVEQLRFNVTGIGFFAVAPVARQASAANLTNSVTAGGTDDTIADFADLTTYSVSAAAIRNDIFQLSRKLKQVNDALRLYGLLT